MNIIEEEIKEIIRDLKIDKKDEQKNKSYAFLVLCNRLINSIEDNNTAEQDITDGYNDYSIDAVHFDATNSTMTILQTKYSKKGLSYNDLELFLQNVDVFLWSDDKTKLYNEQLKEKHKEFKKISKKINKINAFFCINSLYTEEEKVEQLIKKYKKDKINVEIYDIKKISMLYQDFIEPKPLNDYSGCIKYDVGNNYDKRGAVITHSIGQIITYTFFVSYSDFISFLEDYISQCGKIDYLFSKNIRGYLGTDNNSVNEGILQTINDDKNKTYQYFALLNNGITMLCDFADIKPQGGNYSIQIKKPQIINGLQTTMTLYKAYKEKKITKEKTFSIFIRLHRMPNEILENHKYLVEKITNSTNNQTPIITSDMLSNQSFVKELEKLFNLDKQIKLIRKRDSHKIKNNEIRLENALKYWYCIYDPIIAKNSTKKVIKKVYIKFVEEENIEEIKDKEEFYSEVLFCSILYTKMIKKQISKFRNEYDFIQYCNEMLIYLIHKAVKEKKLNKDILIKEKNFKQLKNIQKEQLEIIHQKLHEYKKDDKIKNNTYKAIFVSRQFFELFK